MTKYYVVSNNQIFLSSLLISVIIFCLLTINNLVSNYFQLPIVMSGDSKCVTVINVKNGDNFNCGDVDITLKNYRVKVNG